MEQVRRVYVEDTHRNARLAQLGLTEKIITDAVLAGEAEARQCTDNDPVMARGFTRYFRTVRVLREGTAPLGWHRDNPRNLARTLNPDRTLAIITALGDETTADPDVEPLTKYNKGPMVLKAVGKNYEQLPLFDLPEILSDEAIQATWILLYHVSGDQIRYELSLPVQATAGRPSGWRDRIVFAHVKREPDATFGLPSEEFPPDIDIIVARR